MDRKCSRNVTGERQKSYIRKFVQGSSVKMSDGINVASK